MKKKSSSKRERTNDDTWHDPTDRYKTKSSDDAYDSIGRGRCKRLPKHNSEGDRGQRSKSQLNR